jgi:glycosyltransferase involved in cell wall biosynthesis
MKFLEHKPTVVVYSLDDADGACAAIRILTPINANNWNLIWGAKQDSSGISFELDVARRADLIIIQRHFPVQFNEKILRDIIGLGIPIIYDLDDDFLDIPSFHTHYHSLSKRIPYIKWILKEADLITVSTPLLKEAVIKHTNRPVCIQPNLVDWELFYAQPRIRAGTFNFLVSGTSTHQRDWRIIEEALAKILDTYKNEVNAVFFGDIPERFLNHPSARLVKFEASYNHYAECLRKLDVHAALVPLENTIFNQCKSNIKWLEYSAAGIPGIFSNLAPYNSSICHGETGLLVDNTTDAWFRGMEELLFKPGLASAIIENAQHMVRDQYSVEKLSLKYVAAFNDLLGQSHKSNFFSDLPIFPARLQAQMHQTKNNVSRLLNRHILWRFKQNNKV